MKILFAGKFETPGSHERSEELVLEGFKQNKIDIEKYDLKKDEDQEKELIEKSEDYDWIFFSTAMIFQPWGLRLPERLKCKSALWVYDWMWMSGRERFFIPWTQQCNVVFTTDNMIDWRAYGINHYCVRQGVSKSVHYKVQEDVLFQKKVAFPASLYSRRRGRLHRRLQREFTTGYKRWDLRNHHEKEFSKEAFRRICASSDIMINDKLFDGVREYWSFRVYQILGCGGFLITEFIPGLQAEFCQGVHLVWAENQDEMIDLIKYYLERPDERREIAERGYEWVHEEHSFKRRAEQIIKILGENS